MIELLFFGRVLVSVYKAQLRLCVKNSLSSFFVKDAFISDYEWLNGKR